MMQFTDAQRAGAWFTSDGHFDVTFCDVVAIVASVNGGVAYRGLMIPEFSEELQRTREEQERRKKAGEPEVSCDITELFYKTHSAVRKRLMELGISRDGQICEMRTTLTQKLSLTNMFKPPVNPEKAYVYVYSYVWHSEIGQIMSRTIDA